MKNTLAFVFVAIVLSSVTVRGQEQMTVARFREIASTSGDSVPLNPRLTAGGPLWTNATIAISLKYANGTNFNEVVSETAKTIGGRYVVTTIQSQFYKQPTDSILTFDEKASAYKVWAIFGETVNEGHIVYDFQKKIYAMNSAYGNGFTELDVGSYTATESSDQTQIFKNGILFCTRASKCTPVDPSK